MEISATQPVSFGYDVESTSPNPHHFNGLSGLLSCSNDAIASAIASRRSSATAGSWSSFWDADAEDRGRALLHGLGGPDRERLLVARPQTGEVHALRLEVVTSVRGEVVGDLHAFERIADARGRG
jgi:hypothetical protein